MKSGGLFDRLLDPLIKVDLPLMINLLTLLFKSVLMALGLRPVVSAAEAEMHK